MTNSLEHIYESRNNERKEINETDQDLKVKNKINEENSNLGNLRNEKFRKIKSTERKRWKAEYNELVTK